MAQQYAVNVLLPETRAASDRIYNPNTAIKLRRKYIDVGTSKSPSKRTGGNSGKTGKKHRSELRMHGGGKLPIEQMLAREAQSMAYTTWRASWMSGDLGPQPG